MSLVQLFNGEYYPENTALLPVSNRGFSYGDGFFESMRISNGKLPLLNGHWNRLERACKLLHIQVPENLNRKSFERYALELATKNGFKNARIRFQGFRMGEGRYAPEQSNLGWSMVCQPTESPEYKLNSVGLHVEVCRSHTINPAPQSSFKSSNSLPYVLGGIYAATNHLDDCFLLDSDGFIAEATGSNVFILRGEQLITPDLSNGGVPGVMRSVVLDQAVQIGLTTSESLINIEDVLEADECFLTNAAKGIQWVGAVGKKRYYKRCSAKLTDQINLRLGLFN
jgi:branched-chain amino acid aminotransferase